MAETKKKRMEDHTKAVTERTAKNRGVTVQRALHNNGDPLVPASVRYELKSEVYVPATGDTERGVKMVKDDWAQELVARGVKRDIEEAMRLNVADMKALVIANESSDTGWVTLLTTPKAERHGKGWKAPAAAYRAKRGPGGPSPGNTPERPGTSNMESSAMAVVESPVPQHRHRRARFRSPAPTAVTSTASANFTGDSNAASQPDTGIHTTRLSAPGGSDTGTETQTGTCTTRSRANGTRADYSHFR